MITAPMNLADSMDSRYFDEGADRAMRLGNRGPMRFNADSSVDQRVHKRVHQDILDAYRRYGFYVFEGVIGEVELAELRDDFATMLAQAPIGPGSDVDAHGRPSINTRFTRATFQFAKPLSDPMGGTDSAGGRYEVKMSEHVPPADAPQHTILQISGALEIMDSCLRLYGNPNLLAIAETINGTDFTPFTDAIWVKEPGLGAAVAWHQDGTTHWDSPDLDRDTHGFNFMAQLYRTTPGNALWIEPGSHDIGNIDIKARIAANGGSDQLPTAVPLLCEAGDVALCSRQMLHCSFPNTTSERRVTFVFGFHKRSSVLGVTSRDFRSGKRINYDDKRIHDRSRLISLAIDARHQHFGEPRYTYQPLVGEEDENRWNEHNREHLLKNYNTRDLFI